MSPTLHRPEPVDARGAIPVDGRTPPERAARRLRQGDRLLVTDAYGTGADILDALQAQLPPPGVRAPYGVRQDHRHALRDASLRLLAPVEDHALALRGAQPIPFLRELYPELRRFHLPFVQVQELFGAGLRYADGFHVPVLGHALHPFYGTYAPTRMTHLELFATWISQYEGRRGRAVDVGTGSGVLALLLCRAGFEHVHATDHNPNAVESVRRELTRLTPTPPLTVEHADLLGEDPTPADVVVFNPPWTEGRVRSPLDEALYYERGLFPRFFDAALPRLAPDGRLVIVFSNLRDLVQPEVPHPILAELERGRLTLVQKMRRRVKGTLRGPQAPRRTRERVEVWELARATGTPVAG